jgi:hypothetical protein
MPNIVGFRYIMDRLELVPDVDPTHPQPHPNLTLHQLENALASMTAAIYWSGKPLVLDHRLTLSIVHIATRVTSSRGDDVSMSESKNGQAIVSQLVLVFYFILFYLYPIIVC